MKAHIFSIGERTTDLCRWALERNGFEVDVWDGSSTLWEKLVWLYDRVEEDFVRVDADVIVNKNFKLPQLEKDIWWAQFQTFDWYQQNITHGGVNFIRKEALPALRKNIETFKKAERPESQMFRLEEFHKPRRCITVEGIIGLHGYGQKDLDRVKETKRKRKQLDNYDFELVEKLCQL